MRHNPNASCVVCGSPLYSAPGRPQRYCSKRCSGSVRKGTGHKTERVCTICGANFQVFPSVAKIAGQGTYCSATCGGEGTRRRLTRAVSERLARRTLRTDGCWLWQGPLSDLGYGTLRVAHKNHPVHAVAWEQAGGAPPELRQPVCHTCDVRHCVRNDDLGTYEVDGIIYERRGHLFLGTQLANVRDMIQKGRKPLVPMRSGERHHKFLATPSFCAEVERRWLDGHPSQASIGRALNAHPGLVRRALVRLGYLSR